MSAKHDADEHEQFRALGGVDPKPKSLILTPSTLSPENVNPNAKPRCMLKSWLVPLNFLARGALEIGSVERASQCIHGFVSRASGNQGRSPKEDW